MARPERNNVDYFPFYCDDGKKMFYIEETYGNDGFATFVKILRELAKTDFHYINLSVPTTLMFLSAKCKVSKETLLLIINDLVDLGKFDSVLWKENQIIWCEDFIKGVKDAYQKRNNKCIDYKGLLSLLDSLGVRKLSKQESEGVDNPQSKEDYTKLNKTKLNIPDWIEFLAYGKEKEPNVNDSALKNKYEAWVSNDWKDGNDKEIKNWKSKLMHSMPYIKKNIPNTDTPSGMPKSTF